LIIQNIYIFEETSTNQNSTRVKITTTANYVKAELEYSTFERHKLSKTIPM